MKTPKKQKIIKVQLYKKEGGGATTIKPMPKKQEKKKVRKVTVSKVTCPWCGRKYTFSGVRLYMGYRATCVSKKCASSPNPSWKITKVDYIKI